MESTTVSASAAMSGWEIRELDRAEADDEAVALLARLRPGTADLPRAIAGARQVHYLGAYEQGCRPDLPARSVTRSLGLRRGSRRGRASVIDATSSNASSKIMPYDLTPLVFLALGGGLVVLGAALGPETKDVDLGTISTDAALTPSDEVRIGTFRRS